MTDLSFADFGGHFREKTVLVTGHTGFKGSWLVIWLNQLGAKVCGIALDPPTNPNNYELSRVADLLTCDLRIDIRDRARVASSIKQIQPDVIFHLAAQPIVAYGIENPFETFEINAMGTAVVLEAVRELQRTCAVVVVTSDKCYKNTESLMGYQETDPLGGSEPYGASKAAAENIVNAYRQTFFSGSTKGAPVVSVASARAGNVIGGGDWSPHRVLPDIVSSLSNCEAITLRSPDSVRPWQHVLVPISGYLLLAAKMLSSSAPLTLADAWNFGPFPDEVITVQEVAERAIKLWKSGKWVRAENTYAAHETKFLGLKINKAVKNLGWYPSWNFDRSMERTIDWYRAYKKNGIGSDMRIQCLNDIHEFVTASESDLASPRESSMRS